MTSWTRVGLGVAALILCILLWLLCCTPCGQTVKTAFENCRKKKHVLETADEKSEKIDYEEIKNELAQVKRCRERDSMKIMYLDETLQYLLKRQNVRAPRVAVPEKDYDADSYVTVGPEFFKN